MVSNTGDNNNATRRSFTMRWVGSQVAGNGGSVGSNSSQTTPASTNNLKTIPCIVVSPETSDDEGGFDWETKKNEEGLPFIDNSANNGDDNVDCTTPLMGYTPYQSNDTEIKPIPNIILSGKEEPKLVWQIKTTDQAYPSITNNSENGKLVRKNPFNKQDNIESQKAATLPKSTDYTKNSSNCEADGRCVRRHSFVLMADESTESAPGDGPFRKHSFVSLPDKMQRMTSLDVPRKKTRRNSINDMLLRAGSQMNLSRSPSRLNLNGGPNSDWRTEARPDDRNYEGRDSLICTLSALYAKFLFVIGLAFPVAEIISAEKQEKDKLIPKSLFLSYYFYLYMGSLFFMAYIYIFLFASTQEYFSAFKGKCLQLYRMCMRHRPEMDKASIAPSYKPPKVTYSEHDHGSMYLKLGCVLFGIGGMIFSGLEVGQFFEIEHEPGSDCGNPLLFWVPGACLLFTFVQMYFIVLNSRVTINKHCIIARFGLMHMVGTNLCNWTYVLAQEAKHTIHKLHEMEDDHGDSHGAHGHSAVLGDHHEPTHGDIGHHASAVHGMVESHGSEEHLDSSEHDDDDLIHKFSHTPATYLNDIFEAVNKSQSRVHRSAPDSSTCRQGDVIGALVDKAAPFLFPCSIEYSLIGAAVCYIIWKNIGAKEHKEDFDDIDSEVSCYIQAKARHHYSVDCAHASRGLFMGILIMVFTILYLIIVKNADIQDTMRNTTLIIEFSLYSISLLATIVGMYQMQELEFERESGVELDIILLIIAQCGVYVFTSFNIIGSSFWKSDANFLHVFTTLLKLIQATWQSIFVLHASRRKCVTPEQEDKKPGREMVIFLLICNLSMWFINVFKTGHPYEHRTQLEFYGPWAWTIITHISMPLAIFYRYHITVCLAEIWKRSYKMKGDW